MLVLSVLRLPSTLKGDKMPSDSRVRILSRPTSDELADRAEDRPDQKIQATPSKNDRRKAQQDLVRSACDSIELVEPMRCRLSKR